MSLVEPRARKLNVSAPGLAYAVVKRQFVLRAVAFVEVFQDLVGRGRECLVDVKELQEKIY